MTILTQIIKGFIRLALAGLATWLIEHGIVTAEDTERAITGIAIALTVVVWSVLDKIGKKLTFEVARRLEANVTMKAIREYLSDTTLKEKKEIVLK